MAWAPDGYRYLGVKHQLSLRTRASLVPYQALWNDIKEPRELPDVSAVMLKR